MTPQAIRRGYSPADRHDFSPDALVLLRSAQEEMQWLLDRGYPMKSAVQFVGGHHQLTARQRSALQRATDRKDRCCNRLQRLLPLNDLQNGLLLIDGFNLIITLETALSGSLIVLGADGVLRDLAGLRGTYRVIEQTGQAIRLIGALLHEYRVPQVRFYLDAPVSNSGKLRQAILSQACSWPCRTEVELVPDADRSLSGCARIVSSDSLLLDQCQSWFNLAAELVRQQVPQAWVVSLQRVVTSAC